jgi:sterol 3beta-glucosyltransferase
MIALGSRGDVQPHVALALGLRDAGHEVRMVTLSHFESFVRDHGLEFAPLAEAPLGERSERLRRRWLARGSRLFGWWIMARGAKAVAHRRLAECRAACDGADAIVVSALGTLLGFNVAESMRVPLVRAYCAPASSFGALTPIAFAPAWVNDRLERAVQAFLRQALWQGMRPWVNAARRDVLGLPPLAVSDDYGLLDRQRVPLLYGFSPTLFPPDPSLAWVDVTGFWFLERAPTWEPPGDLVEFLAAGPPPVFVGFGSMSDFVDPRPEATASLVVEALLRSGQRGIVGLPSASAMSLPREIVGVEGIPHDWLFPQVAAAVHHGGSGTTAATLRAGIPSVVVPFAADQPFWGRRIAGLGVGPPPIPRRRLTVERLTDAIRIAVTDTGTRERAAALGERIRAEDGVARAVEALERHLLRTAG